MFIKKILSAVISVEAESKSMNIQFLKKLNLRRTRKSDDCCVAKDHDVVAVEAFGWEIVRCLVTACHSALRLAALLQEGQAQECWPEWRWVKPVG